MMAKHLCGDNISDSWLKAVHYLLGQNNHESFNLLVEITNPLEEDENIKEDLDSGLSRKRLQRIETVANTLFPYELYNNSNNGEAFFKAYKRMAPRLRRANTKNGHGIYFERLVKWPGSNGNPINQIDNIIKRLIQQISSPNPLRVVYEALISHPQLDATVYTPGLDNNYGFPCLSFLSFKLEGDRLNLTAIYRNHYFFERAYGNYLGLARLLNFVCEEVGCPIGNLCVLSTHAQLETGTISIIRNMIQKYPECL